MYTSISKETSDSKDCSTVSKSVINAKNLSDDTLMRKLNKSLKQMKKASKHARQMLG